LAVRLHRHDVEAFAAASGDRNPLHLSADAARRSAFGRPVAHGALVVVTALGRLSRERLARLVGLRIAFHRPVFPGDEYHVVELPSPVTGCVELHVTCAGSLAVGVTAKLADNGRAISGVSGNNAAGENARGEIVASARASASVASAAGGSSASDNATGGDVHGDVTGGCVPRLAIAVGACDEHRYRPAPAELRSLADRLGAASVPDAVLAWLAWASWVVGMRLDGDHVFGRLTVTPDSATPGSDSLVPDPPEPGSPEPDVPEPDVPEPDPPEPDVPEPDPPEPGVLGPEPRRAGVADVDAPLTGPGNGRISVVAVDARTGFVQLAGEYRAPVGCGVRAALHTFRRTAIPPPTRQSVARHLAPGDDLHGRHILVIGASRGLGAALVGALASRGATVWAVYRHSDRDAAALAAEFGPDLVRPVRCDAADPAQVETLVHRLGASGAGPDGLALVATPPLRGHALHPAAVPAQLEFVTASLAVALNPLASCADTLAGRGGWLALISSTAVQRAPQDWLHYAAVKSALETYATQFARSHKVRTLIVRAPKMRTHLVDGPAGAIGAAAPEQVAATITRWVLTPPTDLVTTVS
jgi:NAD(P)-dependent dehydrogenase (short-subunit alcohol dehydrogenase family)